MKKLLTHIAFILALIPAFFSFACTPSNPRVIVESDTYVVINVVDSVEENTTLADYMISLNNDIFAIENAVASDLSNGFVEGTNSKIKMIKRTMYGRCRKILLEAKLMYNPE